MARPHGRCTVVIASLWVLGGAVSLWWNLHSQTLTLFNQARTAARTAIQKDLDYRRWAAVHGGVYVPVTELTKPNPCLARIPVDVDTAIPVGLVVTEIMGNAMKHAHPPSWRAAARRPGLIAVALAGDGEGALRLKVADDGVGPPAGFDIQSSPSMGLWLVRSLVDQMGGTLDFSGSTGTMVTARFPLRAASQA